LDEEGEIRERQIEHEGHNIEQFLRGLGGQARIAVEETGNWHWFVDLVEACGHQVLLSHPKQTKAIAHARQLGTDLGQLSAQVSDRHIVRIKTRSRGWVEVEINTREITSQRHSLEEANLARDYVRALEREAKARARA